MTAESQIESFIGQCGECLFFAAKKDKMYGYCHRFPPKVVFDVGEDCKDNAFPAVTPRDWCGEHQSIHGEAPRYVA